MSTFDSTCSHIENNVFSIPESSSQVQRTDVLICGKCTFHCNNVNDFIQHKQSCPKYGKSSTEKVVEASNITANMYSTAMKPRDDVTILNQHTSVADSIENNCKTAHSQVISNPEKAKLLYETFNVLSENLYVIQNDGKEKIIKHKQKKFAVEKEEPSILMLSEKPNWDKELIQAKKLSVIDFPIVEDVDSFTVNQKISTDDNEDRLIIDTMIPTDCCEVELKHCKPSHSSNRIKLATNENMERKEAIKRAKDQLITLSFPPAKNTEFSKLCTYVDGGLKCSHEGCNFITKHKKNIIRHYTIHTGKKPFSCSICDAKFSRRDKQKLHDKIHGHVKLHLCTEPGCRYRSIDGNGITKHRRIHSNERPHRCQLCPYSAKDSSQLVVHLRSHTGDTPYHCQEPGCTSAFMTSSDLKRHTIIHTGLKPFVCTVCGFASNVKQNLNTHVRLMHREGSRYDCLRCKLKFLNNKQLKVHRKTHCPETRSNHVGKRIRHEILSNFVCELCNSTFVRKDSYIAHMRQHQQLQSQNSIKEIETTPKIIIQGSNFNFSVHNVPAPESDINQSITAEEVTTKSTDLFDSCACVVTIDEVSSPFSEDKTTSANYLF